MRWFPLLLLILPSAACKSSTAFDRYYYQVAGSGPNLPPEVKLSARHVDGGIELIVTNSSTTTVRMLWDRSAIVGPDGGSDAILLQDQRMIEANRPAAPTIIPPKAHVRFVLVPADNVYYQEPRLVLGVSVPGGWRRHPILKRELRRMQPPTFEANDRRISEMYGGCKMGDTRLN